MLFHELYGCYYDCVARILSKAVEDQLSKKDMREIITKHAFSESFLAIEPALREQQWQLLNKDFTTPLQHIPDRPLTLLEKRWLKAISLDPRIALFEVTLQGLEDVAPLYTQEDIIYFDQYLDKENYQDPVYIHNFKDIRSALHQQKDLMIHSTTGKGKRMTMKCHPLHLEYSSKDDKFRLQVLHDGKLQTINLSRISSVELFASSQANKSNTPIQKKYFVMELVDERNALERVMLHFAHFEKEARRIEDHYQIKIFYDGDDETELIIRVLSFGPFVKVLEPESFLSQIKQRLMDQLSCGLR